MLNGIPAATPAAGSDSGALVATGCSTTAAGLYAWTMPPVRLSLVLLLVSGAPTGGPLPGNVTSEGTICGGPGATVCMSVCEAVVAVPFETTICARQLKEADKKRMKNSFFIESPLQPEPA